MSTVPVLGHQDHHPAFAGPNGELVRADVEDAEEVTELDAVECMDLLRTETVGRIGMVVRGRPEIVPVNYSLDSSDSVVLATVVGMKLVFAVNNPVVFEVDHFDAAVRSGWSVIVHGVAHMTERVDAGERPLVAWRTDASHLLRIAQSSLDGRRIHRRS